MRALAALARESRGVFPTSRRPPCNPLPSLLLSGPGRPDHPGAQAYSRGWLLATLLFVLVRAFPNLSYPIARDQGSYCLIGRGLLQGQQLYRDLWDNKPPGIFYIYAAIVKVFGPVMWSVGLVDILWLLGFSFLLFCFAERYLGPAAAGISVVLYSSWHVQAGYWWAAQPEAFLMLFVLASFFVMAGEGRWRVRSLVAGVLLGAAFWVKYNAVAFVPLVLGLPYLDIGQLDGERRRLGWKIGRREWRARAAWCLGGFGAAVGLVLGYFWVVGAWEALKEVQFEVLPRYAAMAFERNPTYLSWAIVRTQESLGLWTECAALAGLLIAWGRRELNKFAPVFLAAGIGYLALAMQVRFHDYMFETCLPFFAMVAAYVVVRVYESFRQTARECRARGWRVVHVMLWILLANIFFWPLPDESAKLAVNYQALHAYWREGNRFYESYSWARSDSHFSDQLRVIGYLQENTSPGDKVFVWGNEPLIYFLSQRRASTRFISNLALVSVWGPPAWQRELLRDLKNSWPRFIVVARNDSVPTVTYTNWDSEECLQTFPELATFISDNYHPVADLRDFSIYQHELNPQETESGSERSERNVR